MRSGIRHVLNSTSESAPIIRNTVIQLSCYASMLETIQGAEVCGLHLALGDGTRVRLGHSTVRFFFDALRREFLEFHDGFDAGYVPEPEPGVKHTRWEGEAARRTRDTDGLGQVARITRVQIRRLRAQGIATLNQLADHDGSAVQDILSPTLDRLTSQARLQRASEGRSRPAYELITAVAPGRGPALEDLPDASPLDVSFDLEGYPLVANGLEYLWGALGDDGFKDWWAFDPPQERVAFEGFLRWILERRLRDPAMHVYHYGAYETNVLKRLAARHGSLETELDMLLREERFVDLYPVVRNAVRIGEPSYSLKNVEKLYREAREGGVATAADSIVEYDRWQLSGQPADWRRSEILESIRRYNHADCASTLELVGWLRTQRDTGGPNATPRPDERPETEQRRLERERRMGRQRAADRTV